MQYYGDLLRKLTKSNTTEICEFFVKKWVCQEFCVNRFNKQHRIAA